MGDSTAPTVPPSACDDDSSVQPSLLGEYPMTSPLLTEELPPSYSCDISVKIYSCDNFLLLMAVHPSWLQLCFVLNFWSGISCVLVWSSHFLPPFVFMVIYLILPCLFHAEVFAAFIASCPGSPCDR